MGCMPVSDLKGPMMPANTQKLVNQGVPMRQAVAMARMREPQPKMAEKVK